jgi:hypothetical protein
MQEISVLNKEIDLNCTESYRLSIQISLNGFSFGIKDDIKNEYLVLKTYVYDRNRLEHLIGNINEIISLNPLLSKSYKSSNIIIECEKKSIIPKDLFSKEHINDTFALSHNLHTNESLFFDTNNFNTVCVFAIQNDIAELINLHFPKANIRSSLSPILYYGLSKDEQYYSITINKVKAHYFDILITNKNKIVLFNTFKYIEDIDIAFHVLNSLKTLGLNNQECKIIYSGEFDEYSQTSELLKKHINISEEISILSSNKELKKNNIKPHFANLLNAELCE